MINEELKKYIEENIFKENNKNDIGHNMEHVSYVINRSLRFAEEIADINMNMVYVVAAYHDIGHHIDAKNHEVVSSIIFLKDLEMRKYFSVDEIKIISEAILDHRASNDFEPRSIYGKIVSSADRNTSLDEPLKRTYRYTLNHCPGLSIDEMVDRAYNHLSQKYGQEGYAKEKMYFKDDEYEVFLKDLGSLLKDKEKFRKKYILINKIK